VDGAIQTARNLTANKPGLAFNTAVMTLDATGAIAWRLQAPMAPSDDALPPGAGL
jgi:hypothetical protein